MVELLIAAGAEINNPNKEGETPLWIACRNIDLTSSGRQIVKILLAAGADPNRLANDGTRPVEQIDPAHQDIIDTLLSVPISLQTLCHMQIYLQEIRSKFNRLAGGCKHFVMQ